MARPREFDEALVIAEALDLFWAQGFSGTSLDALEQSTGLNRSSLYGTFGDKLGLFIHALDAYSAGPCRQLAQPFRDSEGAAALSGYLEGLQRFLRSPHAGRGCLMVNTSLAAPTSADVQGLIEQHFAGLRADFTRAYRQAVQSGELPSTMQPKDASGWLLTIVRGVLVGAATGESGATLQRALRTTARQLGL